MNWVMAGGIAVSIPLLLFYRENYNRLDVDVSESSPDGNTEPTNDKKQTNGDEGEGDCQVSCNGNTKLEEEEDDRQSMVSSFAGQVNGRC